MFPSWCVQIGISEGPIVDPDVTKGVCHVDPAFQKVRTVKTQLSQVKNQFEFAVVLLARRVAMHMPDLVIGHGQGAMVAMAYAQPRVMECCLQQRNVQQEECKKLARGWAGVRGVIGIEPRLTRASGLWLGLLNQALPSLGVALHIMHQCIAAKSQKQIGRPAA